MLQPPITDIMSPTRLRIPSDDSRPRPGPTGPLTHQHRRITGGSRSDDADYLRVGLEFSADLRVKHVSHRGSVRPVDVDAMLDPAYQEDLIASEDLQGHSVLTAASDSPLGQVALKWCGQAVRVGGERHGHELDHRCRDLLR